MFKVSNRPINMFVIPFVFFGSRQFHGDVLCNFLLYILINQWVVKAELNEEQKRFKKFIVVKRMQTVT